MTPSDTRYGAVSRGLHWTVALLMAVLLGLGWYMVDLNYFDRWYYASLEWHKALGMLALAAGVAMVSSAVVSHRPVPPASMAAWERWGARSMRLTLFAMMVAIPSTGYLISTSAGDGISIFGWIEVPAISPANEELHDLAVLLHYYFAYATSGLVALHATAALKHEFVDRDGILRRML